MEVLTLNGKRYVKASKAAKDLGYATDYVGQLCRSGAVDAQLVGRTWYVDPDTLGAHRLEKKRNARVKAREYAKKSIAETRALRVEKSRNTYNNIAIRYEGDSEELIPEVKKLTIATSKIVAPKELPNEMEGKGYVIENKDKKILMSGSIPVYDADEETVLTDVTILTPKILRTVRKKETAPEPEEEVQLDIKEETDHETESESVAEPLPFARKLAEREVVNDGAAGEESSPTLDIQQAEVPRSSARYLVLQIASLVIIALSAISVFLEAKSVYGNGAVEGSIAFDTENIVDYISQNIDISSIR
jgi:hypothetical protein